MHTRSSPIAAAMVWDEDGEDGGGWEVEAILDKRICTAEDCKVYRSWVVGTPLYLIAWEGYEESQNTWEPAENISDELVADYEERSCEAEMQEAAEAAALTVGEDTDVCEGDKSTDATPEGGSEAGSIEVQPQQANEVVVQRVTEHYVAPGVKAGSLDRRIEST